MASINYKCEDCQSTFSGNEYSINCSNCNSTNVSIIQDDNILTKLNETYKSNKMPFIIGLFAILVILILIINNCKSDNLIKKVVIFDKESNYIEIQSYLININKKSIKISQNPNPKFEVKNKYGKILTVNNKGFIYPCESGTIYISYTDTAYYKISSRKLQTIINAINNKDKKEIDKIAQTLRFDFSKKKRHLSIISDSFFMDIKNVNEKAQCYTYSFEVEEKANGLLQIKENIIIKNNKDTTVLDFKDFIISINGPEGEYQVYNNGKIQLANKQKYDVVGIAFGDTILEPKGGKGKFDFSKINLETLRKKAMDWVQNNSNHQLREHFFAYIEGDKNVMVRYMFKGVICDRSTLVDNIRSEKCNTVTVIQGKHKNNETIFTVSFK